MSSIYSTNALKAPIASAFEHSTRREAGSENVEVLSLLELTVCECSKCWIGKQLQGDPRSLEERKGQRRFPMQLIFGGFLRIRGILRKSLQDRRTCRGEN